MKQLRAVVLKSILFVFATAFLWTGVFYMALDHAQKYRAQTDVKYRSSETNPSVLSDSTIEYLSDDATRVRVETIGFGRRTTKTWETGTGNLVEQSTREAVDPRPWFNLDHGVLKPNNERIIAVSDDGQMAIAIKPNPARFEFDFQWPPFILWDLTTSKKRAELNVGSAVLLGPPDFHFSSDGRFVFARAGASLYWWDTEYGNLCRVTDAHEFTVHQQVGVVITHSLGTDTRSGLTITTDDHRFQIWDIATGQQIGERRWEAKVPAEIPAHRMVTSSDGNNIAMVFDVDFDGQGHLVTMAKRLGTDFFQGSRPERSWVLVVNVIDQREFAHLPGRSACFSQNGDWLATLDEDGIVRVWHLPLRQPWQKIIRNAELATLITWALILPAAWLVRLWIARRKLSNKNKTDKPISD